MSQASSHAEPLPTPLTTPGSLLKCRRSTSNSPEEAPQKRTRIPSAAPSLSDVRETQEESRTSITAIELRQFMDNQVALLKEIQALKQEQVENITPEINDAMSIIKASEKADVVFAKMQKDDYSDISQDTIYSQEESPPRSPVDRMSGKEAHERHPLNIVQLTRSSIQRMPPKDCPTYAICDPQIALCELEDSLDLSG
ncbi:hypothetical protein LEN26_017248 [Aphanomyces euteiches]|nr:hypothetical protein LEN26_017248 [Aphanomyces euteiches]KAH9185504.1 hypothetical protein AeNC1_012520 [Aphanomyces euteiches]